MHSSGEQRTPARIAPRNPNERARSRRPPHEGVRGDALSSTKTERLSATDISALASMKNVAKCDTWCELQNPVNHRVFERKLRPKPLGRGHVCLGVTHCVAPQNPHPPQGSGARGGGGCWPPVRSRARLVEKLSPRRCTPRRVVVDKTRTASAALRRSRRAARGSSHGPPAPVERRCFSCDPRSGGTTR